MSLPYPTPDRLKLADAIAAGKVRHYPFQEPKTFNDITGGIVTAKVQFLLGAGLVEVPEPPAEYNYAVVRLTPDGMAWVTRARTSKINAGGPVSTSPETGPSEEDFAAVIEYHDEQIRAAYGLPSTKDEERTEGDA